MQLYYQVSEIDIARSASNPMPIVYSACFDGMVVTLGHHSGGSLLLIFVTKCHEYNTFARY